MIGHDLWRRRFGGDPDVVGRSLTVAGGQRIAIVGVMGPELDQLGPLMPGECWFAQPVDPTDGTWLSYLTFGRLAPGTSLAQVNAELASLSSTLGHDPISKEPRTLRAMLPLDRAVAGVRTQLLFVFGAVACVLLVTCANVVNLFLAHAAGRRDELSTRVALGASRARLVRQSLTESLTVSLLGGTLGFLLAVWSVPVLVSLAPADLPRLTQIGVDWSTFLFTLGVSVGSGLLCGLLASLPARLAPRTLVGAVHAATTPRTMRLRRALTVCEIALALMLVVAASLMVRTVRALDAIDLGFDPRQVVVARLNLDARNFARTQDRHMAIVERVKALPGITAAGIGSGPLTGGMGIGGLVVPGNPREFDFVRVDAVSPGYFEALGARLVAGRFFEPRDAVRAGPRVILVNQTAARAFWNGDDPIGKSVVINETEELRVLGVIADIRGATLEQDPGPAVFQVANQSTNFLANSMLIRVDGDPEALVRPIRDIIRSVNREAPFTGVEPLQQRIDRAMAPRLFVLRVVGLFTIIGLMLAVVGVYGVIAELAVQRVPEIGVRMAFGATASNVLALILGQGARLVSIGLVLGLIGAGLLRGAMTSLVYGVRTSDPLTYAAAAIVLFAAAVAACAIPAVLASRLDPATALRTE
jgi:predicted permease